MTNSQYLPSPQRFLTRIRLERARKLLATEFLTVKEVMNQVGMSDASSFARSFKAAYGVTPGQYRAAPGTAIQKGKRKGTQGKRALTVVSDRNAARFSLGKQQSHASQVNKAGPNQISAMRILRWGSPEKLTMYSELSNREIVTTVHRPSTGLPGNAASATIQSSKANVSGLDRRIQVVVMLLESNSHKQIAVEDMARLVNLSVGRLAHLFKSEMNVSIQQYLTQLRLAKAKSQLETSFLSIKEIAASVGFSSVTRFVACFKSFAGATPAHYRKHILNPSYRGAGILS